MSPAVCSSLGDSICRYSVSNTIATGYSCMSSVCHECPPGYYGTDGISCHKCRFGTWSVGRATACDSKFTYTKPGLVKVFIPFGVTKINVRLWGGGGAGDACSGAPYYLPSAGGGGGFSTCNVTIPMNTSVYVIVAGGAISNPNNFIPNNGGKLPMEATSYQKPCCAR